MNTVSGSGLLIKIFIILSIISLLGCIPSSDENLTKEEINKDRAKLVYKWLQDTLRTKFLIQYDAFQPPPDTLTQAPVVSEQDDTTVQPQPTAVFSDDFSTDSRDDYTVINIWPQGGEWQFLYDLIGHRLQVITGDDIALRFEKTIPAPHFSGVFDLDFLPTVKFPIGGQVSILLMQDANNYYQIINSDGYGPGTVNKVVNGQVVDSAAFSTGYNQNTNYHLRVIFTPKTVRFEAFGQVLTLTHNDTGIMVEKLQVELAQQSGYIDNINLTGDIPNFAPTAVAGQNHAVTEGQSVVLDGSGSVDPDGAIVNYSWKQIAGVAVSFDTSAVRPSFAAPQVTLASQTLGFTLTVTDDSGAAASDTVLVTVQPQAPSVFSDDFSTDSRAGYTAITTSYQGIEGQFLYDAVGRRLEVVTGDNIALLFEKTMPIFPSSGVFELDFLPTKKFPAGGQISLLLMQDANNYYKIINTDGYAPGSVSKVVNGQIVASAGFSSGYSQNTNYHVRVIFTPESARFEAFGQIKTLTGNNSGIMVGTLQTELAQQSGYFDNISFTDNPNAQNLDPIAQFSSQLRNLPKPFTVVFNASSSSDPDGTIVQYLWEFGDGNGAEGALATHSYTSAGTYPVTLTVVDDHGSSSFKVMNIANNADRYVAIGDSITRGSHDDITADGTGFEPILAGLLKNETRYINTVANEGVSGDTSMDGVNLLTTTLAKYPDAHYVFILYGTNDAFIPVPSGLGLTSGNAGYAGTFKDNMQKMIARIRAGGKVPYLAKIPFATGNYAYLNPLIEKYNKVVDELAAADGIAVVPPNLYCLFENNPTQLADGLHPNGIGYQSMARWWFNALTNLNSGGCY